MKLAGIVSTLNCHGGVRRYFELGNAFVTLGHEFELYGNYQQSNPMWMQFNGKLCNYFEPEKAQDIDIVFSGDTLAFSNFKKMKAKKHVVMVVSKFNKDGYLKLWKEVGKQYTWIGAATDWNLGMKEIEGVCIPGGVNTNFFHPPQERKEHEKLRVLFHARKDANRGVDMIKEIAKKVGDQFEIIGVDSVGYPIFGIEIPNIQIIYTTQEILAYAYQNVDIVLSAMTSAGWNNVVAEGMASGCVPISTLPGTKDLILSNETGFVYNTADEAVDILRTLDKNRSMLKMMSDKAIAQVQQFNWIEVAKKYLEV